MAYMEAFPYCSNDTIATPEDFLELRRRHDHVPKVNSSALEPLQGPQTSFAEEPSAVGASPAGHHSVAYDVSAKVDAERRALLKVVRGHVCAFPTLFLSEQVLSTSEILISQTTVPL